MSQKYRVSIINMEPIRCPTFSPQPYPRPETRPLLYHFDLPTLSLNENMIFMSREDPIRLIGSGTPPLPNLRSPAPWWSGSAPEEIFQKHGPFHYVYHLAAYAAEGLSHFIPRCPWSQTPMCIWLFLTTLGGGSSLPAGKRLL